MQKGKALVKNIILLMQRNRKRQIKRKRKKEIKVLIVNVIKMIIHVNLNYVADHINCTKNSRLYKYLVLAFIKTKKEKKNYCNCR